MYASFELNYLFLVTPPSPRMVPICQTSLCSHNVRVTKQRNSLSSNKIETTFVDAFLLSPKPLAGAWSWRSIVVNMLQLLTVSYRVVTPVEKPYHSGKPLLAVTHGTSMFDKIQ